MELQKSTNCHQMIISTNYHLDLFVTAAYHLSKNFAKLMSPLSKSEYTIKNTNYFAEKIKKEHISNDYLLVSLLQSHSFQMLH